MFPSHTAVWGEPANSTRCGRSFTRYVLRLFDQRPFAEVLVPKSHTCQGNGIVSKKLSRCVNIIKILIGRTSEIDTKRTA